MAAWGVGDPASLCVGIDVGGPRKGLHLAAVNCSGVRGLEGNISVERAAQLVAELAPEVVGIDSPLTAAPVGESSRADEREFARAGICGIRYTPDEATIRRPHRSDYYGWIVHGWELRDALAQAFEGFVVEVFPTAAWTQWVGPRGERTRARWTREALARLDLAGVPPHTNQDERDAIAAALTARQHAAEETIGFGEIVVPVRRSHL